MEEKMINEKIYNTVCKLAVERGENLNDVAYECGRAKNFFYVFKHTSKGLNTLLFWKKVANRFGITLDELIGDI